MIKVYKKFNVKLFNKNIETSILNIDNFIQDNIIHVDSDHPVKTAYVDILRKLSRDVNEHHFPFDFVVKDDDLSITLKDENGYNILKEYLEEAHKELNGIK